MYIYRASHRRELFTATQGFTEDMDYPDSIKLHQLQVVPVHFHHPLCKHSNALRMIFPARCAASKITSILLTRHNSQFKSHEARSINIIFGLLISVIIIINMRLSIDDCIDVFTIQCKSFNEFKPSMINLIWWNGWWTAASYLKSPLVLIN